MYLFNPIWAQEDSFSSEEENAHLSFSDELLLVAHRLSPQSFNDSLYQYCRVNNVHREIYYQDTDKRFAPSSLAINPFVLNDDKHWICSIGVGQKLDVNVVAPQLKFLLKGEPLYSVNEWHNVQRIAPYIRLLEDADILTRITLQKLGELMSKKETQ